jgi:hypothetical protein
MCDTCNDGLYAIKNAGLLKKINKIKHWKHKYIRREILKFVKKNKIPFTFLIASDIDNYLFGFSGNFRSGGFNYPLEDQKIVYNKQVFYAKQCGLFTFCMS